MAPKWISDGSAEVVSEVATQVNCNLEKSTGDVYNALWEDGEGVSEGLHYWKLQIDLAASASIFVGLTDKDKFKKGWALKGLLYGGNLSNGGALLVEQFGPTLKSGDTVGILASFESDIVKVYFDVNNRCLGLAFDLPSNIFKGLYPTVQFNGKGSVKIEKAEPPTCRDRVPAATTGLEGDWELVKNEFKVNGEAVNVPSPVTMQITKAGGTESYSVNMNVVNNLHFTLEHKDSTWVTSEVRSTKMMGPPESMALEGQMLQLKSSPTKIELDGTNLIWNNSSSESKWQKVTVQKLPVTRNPFQ